MSSEITLRSVDFDEFDKQYGASFAPHDVSKSNLHEAIFSRKNDALYFAKKFSLHIDLLEVEQRTQKAARDNNKEIKSMDSGGNVEVKIEAKWGDKDGPSVSVGASGEIHDDNGNYAKGEIKQDSNGDGGVSISAGHKEEKEDKK